MIVNDRNARMKQHLALTAMLLLTACGGDNSSTPSDPPPTLAPTIAPTAAPTPAPTPAPTAAPTPAPTAAPTPAPTSAPTPAPTPAPDDPVLAPTQTPLRTISNAPGPWPDITSGTGKPIDGVGCGTAEDYHVHSLLSIYKDGVRLGIPAEIGLHGCAYELHTHDHSGVVHNETDMKKDFTFGQFFAVWGKELTTTSVAGLTGDIRFFIIENGKLTRYTGDPAAVMIASHRELLVTIGKPPAMVPNYSWAQTGL